MNNNDKSILTILQQIQSGEIDPRDLGKELRQDLVEVLQAEGRSNAQMSEFLKVCYRTIKRDTDDLAVRNALTPSPEMAKKLVGELKIKAEINRAFLMRLSRSQEATAGEKAIAEYYSWKVMKELFEKLQLSGYLPLVPHNITAEIYHHDEDDTKSLSELKEELATLEKIAEKDGILDDEMRERIKILLLKIEKSEIANDINKLNNDKKESDNEKAHE